MSFMSGMATQLISDVVRKRARASVSGGPSTQAYPVAAGAVNVIQRRSVRRRTGKRVNRKSVEYLYRLQKAVTSTVIQRWQAMSEYDKNGFLPIGYQRITSGTGGGEYNYPVYLFDITSCRMLANATALVANPMYRLTSDLSDTGSFIWTVVAGQDAGGGGVFGWQTESGRGADDIRNAPSFGPSTMLAWSDIRLAMYGATGQSTRFTVQFIQFIDECYHPRAAREDGVIPTTLNSDTNDQRGRFNAAMQELVKPLVYHPLHVAGNAQNVYRVLSSKSYMIGADTTTNEAIASPNVLYKEFKRMNRICKWNWQTTDQKATTTSTEHKIGTEFIAGLDSISDYNQFFGGTKKPYVHPNARVYMLIYAQAYTRTGVQNPVGDPPVQPADVAISSVNTPSFDVIVRNKWLYDAV